MDDLISRQAAIDALEEPCKVSDTWTDEYAVGERMQWEKDVKVLNSLPSAQPETHEERTETHACDCIERQAAMEEISKQQTYKMFEGEDTLYFDANDVGSVIASLPSAHPDLEEAYICGETEAEARFHAQQRWIPCSERLPDQYGNYLISIKGEEPDIGTINPNDPRGWSLCDANGFYWANDKMLNIIAWMPLPEPYAERRTDGSKM